MPSSTTDELPVLTDEDVEILYAIVKAAQASADPPFRALFSAYDAILPQYGINPDHDQVYFRFLLRMGSEENGHGSLYQRFVTLLDKLHIQIEVHEDSQGAALEEITRNLDGLRMGSDGIHNNACASRSNKTSRRASIASVQPPTIPEETWRSRSSDASHTRERSQARVRTRPSSRATDPTSGRSVSRGPRARQSSQQPARGRVSTQSVTVHDNRVSNPKRPNGHASHGSNGHHAPRMQSITGLPYRISTIDREETQRSDQDRQPMEEEDPYGSSQHQPSETQMSIEAEAFDYQRSVRAARSCWAQWRAKSLHMRQMHHAAERYDQDILKRQAVEQWRVALQERRQAAETERFFDHMERRADKARDLFLLTKAFTHWARSALDEIQRTSVAQRHIIRYKYFNAWLEITAVNELKVRRQRIGTYFNLWLRRTIDSRDTQYQAITHYQRNLAQRVFWDWFWKFCEQRAPIWSAGRSRRNHFIQWVQKTRASQQQQAQAEHFRAGRLVRRTFSAWISRLRAAHQDRLRAEQHQKVTITKKAIATLHKWTQLSPPYRQLTSSVDTGIARTALTVWANRMQSVRRAVDFDRFRLMDNAWTTWNDNLRCRELRKKIDERLLLQALYKWLLAERCELLKRISKAKLLRTCLTKWAAKARSVEGTLVVAEDALRIRSNGRCLRSAFHLWREASQEQVRQEELAIRFRNPRILRGPFELWAAKMQQVAKLQRWAADANFYVLCSGTLKKWQAKTEATRRAKRREAYSLVRRNAKKNLVQRLFRHWHDSTIVVVAMEQQAVRSHADRIRNQTFTIFRNWQIVASDMARLINQAHEIQHQKLLQRAFELWLQKHNHIRSLDDRAVGFHTEALEATAARCMRNLNWRLFQVNRQNETAIALYHRNQDKHFKNMLRYWAERTVSARQARQLQAPKSPERGGVAIPVLNAPVEEEDEEAMTRAEDWTAFDDFELSGFLGANTPLPGYMRTPSKRGVRSRARFRTGGSATVSRLPAPVMGEFETPMVTPFQTKLREGLSGDGRGVGGPGVMSVDRGRFGGRRFGGERSAAFTGFEDIPEHASREEEGL